MLSAVGHHHICIVINGYVQCVGKNNNYQLGTGVAEPSIAKQFLRSKVWDQYKVDKIICGTEYTCILSQGRVLCIGLIPNKKGEKVIYSHPYSVPNLRNMIDIYSSQTYVCAIDESYAISCWGSNMYLDSNTTNEEGITSSNPLIVESLSGNMHVSQVPKLALADNYLCASIDSAKIKCIGQWSGEVDVHSSVKDIVAGSDHVCTLLYNGDVLCWGMNEHGAVGTISTEHSFIEQPTLVLEDVKQIDATHDSTCALTNSGQAYAWGQNEFFQLCLCDDSVGLCDDSDSFAPSKVSCLRDNAQVESIHLTALTGHAILKGNGGILSWGTDTYGTLGDGESDPTLQSCCYTYKMKFYSPPSNTTAVTGTVLPALFLIIFAIALIIFFRQNFLNQHGNSEPSQSDDFER